MAAAVPHGSYTRWKLCEDYPYNDDKSREFTTTDVNKFGRSPFPRFITLKYVEMVGWYAISVHGKAFGPYTGTGPAELSTGVLAHVSME